MNQPVDPVELGKIDSVRSDTPSLKSRRNSLRPVRYFPNGRDELPSLALFQLVSSEVLYRIDRVRVKPAGN